MKQSTPRYKKSILSGIFFISIGILIISILPISTEATGIQPGVAGVIGVCADGTTSCYQGTSTVLHIGDSHAAGSYGQNLHAILSSQGYSVTTYGCVGADAQDYDLGVNCDPRLGSIRISNQNLKQSLTMVSKQVISDNPAKIVIISLGTNFLTTEGVLNQEDNINNLLNELSSSSDCIWVGAPSSTASKVHVQEINNQLHSIVSSRCTFIDASTMTSTSDLVSDGIHFNEVGGKQWADKVANTINPNILLSTISPALINDEADQQLNEQSINLALPGDQISSTPTPLIPSHTRNIDDAWQRFASLINPQLSSKVFLPTRGWTEYTVAYPTPITPSSSTTSGTTTSYNLNLKVLPEEQKAMVKAAVQAEGIPDKENLALKLLAAESSGDPNAISPTGCVGLMQICTISPVSDIIVHHCDQIKKKGPQMCGQYQDDRFDPQKSIQGGVRILKLNLQSTRNACPNANNQCGVAGYNIGAAVVKDAASKAGPGATWDQIYAQINTGMLQAHGYTGPYWTQEHLDQKVKQLGGYVAKITS